MFKKIMVGGVAAAAIAAAGIAAADPANAAPVSYSSPNTTGYINQLIEDGINPYPIGQAIAVGNRVCSLLSQGWTTLAIASILSHNDPSLPFEAVDDLAIAANVYLCPNADGSTPSSASGDSSGTGTNA